MLDIVIDSLIDSLKLIPFLFIVFFLLELFEHKFSDKTNKFVKKSGKYGPLVGGLLGAIPQCGFSVMATNLYVARIVSVGTLISIYLATSDEMLPVMLSNNMDLGLILTTILIKVFIGMLCGLLIDIFLNKKDEVDIHSLCEQDHCDCDEGILKSSIIHTLKIFIFMFIISVILGFMIHYLSIESMEKIFMKNSILANFLSSLLGLIPNCAASVLITELYVSNIISYGVMMSGLLTGSGVAIMLLFKENKDLKNNLLILSTIYLIGVVSGIIIDLFI